jgi:hypothetical protein
VCSLTTGRALHTAPILHMPPCTSLISIATHRPDRRCPAPSHLWPPCCSQTAATLHDQTNQLNKIVDDLNEIEFTMKKASKVITDIGRGLVTDK